MASDTYSTEWVIYVDSFYYSLFKLFEADKKKKKTDSNVLWKNARILIEPLRISSWNEITCSIGSLDIETSKTKKSHLFAHLCSFVNAWTFICLCKNCRKCIYIIKILHIFVSILYIDKCNWPLQPLYAYK